MRHATTHLAIALCTTIAVSSSPVSPNPVSPALVTPMMIPEKDMVDLDNNDQNTSTPQKRSIGGFAYHNVNNNELSKRGVGEPEQSNNGGQVNQYDVSDYDSGMSSGYESLSDDEVGSASDAGMQKRSIPEIWARSPPASPMREEVDISNFDDNASIASNDDNMSVMSDYDDASALSTGVQRRSIPRIWARSPPASPIQEEAGVSNFDDNASIASADDNMSVMSDDDSSSIASADSFSDNDYSSVASDYGDGEAGAAEEANNDRKDNTKVEARSIDMGGESERHGGRNYMSVNSWNA